MYTRLPRPALSGCGCGHGKRASMGHDGLSGTEPTRVAQPKADDVMYLLAAGTIEEQTPLGGFVYYNRHDSGTSGLVYFKERLGFAAADVEWLL